MNSLFSLENKRVLITGSGLGIGFLIAKGLAESGAEVIVNATTPQGADEAAAALQQQGFKAHAVAFNVTQSHEVNAAVEKIELEIGPIDVLVNNAGIQRRRPFLEFPEQDWNEVIAVNQTGVFLVSQAVARRMVTRGRGKIINIGSMQSELGRETITPYAASKEIGRAHV